MTEFLTLREAADLLRLKPQTVTNMIHRGIFVRGVHYYRRETEIGVRFKRQALVAWLEGGKNEKGAVIRMAKGYILGESNRR